MLDRHYAGVIANWDGDRVPAAEQIRRARPTSQATRMPPRQPADRRVPCSWWNVVDVEPGSTPCSKRREGTKSLLID